MEASPSAEMSGLRASGLVFLGVGTLNLGNYLFHLLSARHLGPSSYGDVATLAAVATIIGLPLGGIRIFVARHVASKRNHVRRAGRDAYLDSFAGATLAAGGFVTLVLLAASPLIRSALSIHSLAAVIFTVLLTAPAFLAPVLLGAIQGDQRFLLVAVAIGAPALVRVALAAGALESGLGVAGVMAATLASTLVALAIPLTVLRHRLGPPLAWRPRLPRRELVALLPVLGGQLAITCLSTDDVVAAKAAFSAHEAGLYGSASLIGRVILYLPAAIVTVLLPRVSAHVSAARGTRRLFVESFLATTAFCVAATLIYALAPHLIVRIAFGSSYEGSASLLWMFGLAMTLYALLNVLLFYRLGHGETQTCWLLLGGAGAQALLFAALHNSPRELIGASIATGAVLLVAAAAGPSSSSPLSLREFRRRAEPRGAA